jgi:excinuclease ABC subunit A
LAKIKRGRHNLYILDEPTTGLHFADISRLLDCLNRLVDSGHSVIVIEHNLDVIKTADHVIDLGPEGGHDGGLILATGTPAEITASPDSHTGRFFAPYLTRAQA